MPKLIIISIIYPSVVFTVMGVGVVTSNEQSTLPNEWFKFIQPQEMHENSSNFTKW